MPLSTDWSAVCGYTEADVERVFGPWLSGLDRADIRSWYNGYSWTGEAVYNPFDILLLLRDRQFRPYWYETGTPTFLTKLMKEQPWSLPDLDVLRMTPEMLGSFDVDKIGLAPLLFQTGYLTIKSFSSSGARGTSYRLGFPNREVRQSFSTLGLELSGSSFATDVMEKNDFADLVEAGDADGLRLELEALFASIPYTWHIKNPIAKYEGYWASVVYAWFAAAGWELVPEDTTNRGRVDLTVKTRTGIWLFEFKVKGLNTGARAVPEEK